MRHPPKPGRQYTISEPLANRPGLNTFWNWYHWTLLVWVELIAISIHCSRKRQHDWLTDSRIPLGFEECWPALQNLVNINTLSNALIYIRQKLWLAESAIPSPREMFSAQAGLPGLWNRLLRTWLFRMLWNRVLRPWLVRMRYVAIRLLGSAILPAWPM